MTNLRVCLPGNSLSYFFVKRVGRYWGASIVCPHCLDRPDHGIPPHARWKWLTGHIVEKHSTGQKLVPIEGGKAATPQPAVVHKMAASADTRAAKRQ